MRHFRHTLAVVTKRLLLRVRRPARPRPFRPVSRSRAPGVHQLPGLREMGSRPFRLARNRVLGSQFRRAAGLVVRGRLPGPGQVSDRAGHYGAQASGAGRHGGRGPWPDRQRSIVVQAPARPPTAGVHFRRGGRQDDGRPSVQADGRVGAHIGPEGTGGRRRRRVVHVRLRPAPQTGLQPADDVRPAPTDTAQRLVSRGVRVGRRELRPVLDVFEGRLRFLRRTAERNRPSGQRRSRRTFKLSGQGVQTRNRFFATAL